MREAKRQNLGYRKYAVPSLGKVASARTDVDMFDTVFDTVQPIFCELVTQARDDCDAMEVDGKRSEEPLRYVSIRLSLNCSLAIISVSVL